MRKTRRSLGVHCIGCLLFAGVVQAAGGVHCIGCLLFAGVVQAGDDDDQYSEPKTAVGEINLQQMRVLTGEASLDSYCRSMKRFGWELATSSCVIHSDPWSVPSRSLTHAYRSNSNDDADFYDAAIRVLSRRSVRGDVISDAPTSSSPSHARATANPLVQAAVRRHVRRQREEVARDTGQIPRAQRSSSRMRWQ